jgi:hypothetical protein
MFNEETQIDPNLRGVNGWLLFFIITLIVIAPMMTLFAVFLFFVAWETLLNFQPFGLFALCVTGLDALVAVVGMVIGVMLLRRRLPQTVRTAQTFLLLRGGYIVVSRLFLLINLYASSVTIEYQASFFSNIPFSLLAGLVYTLVWYMYLERSQRVLATYILEDEPEPERPPAPPVFER